jgi:tetratricopeptide (TPR) repeat protein
MNPSEADSGLQWQAIFPDEPHPGWIHPTLKRFETWLFHRHDPLELLRAVCSEVAPVTGHGVWRKADPAPRNRLDLSPNAWSVRYQALLSVGLQVICLPCDHPPVGTLLLLDFSDVKRDWDVQNSERVVAETVIRLSRMLPCSVPGFPERDYPWNSFSMIYGQWNFPSRVPCSVGDVWLTPGSLREARHEPEGELFPVRHQLELGVSFDFNDGKAWVNWGIAHGYFLPDERTLAAFDRALAINPNDDEALTKRGHPFLPSGRRMAPVQADPFTAINHYERALALNPANQEACYFRAGVLRDLGRSGEARAAFEWTIRIDPKTKWAGYASENLTR